MGELLTGVRYNPERFVLGRDAIYRPASSRPCLNPKYVWEMIDFWNQVLENTPTNLCLQSNSDSLDIRGYNIDANDKLSRFEVHARESCLGVEFHLYQVHGFNGTRRLERLKGSANLGAILEYLKVKEDQLKALEQEERSPKLKNYRLPGHHLIAQPQVQPLSNNISAASS